jgi:hypothetical protein
MAFVDLNRVNWFAIAPNKQFVALVTSARFNPHLYPAVASNVAGALPPITMKVINWDIQQQEIAVVDVLQNKVVCRELHKWGDASGLIFSNDSQKLLVIFKSRCVCWEFDPVVRMHVFDRDPSLNRDRWGGIYITADSRCVAVETCVWVFTPGSPNPKKVEIAEGAVFHEDRMSDNGKYLFAFTGDDRLGLWSIDDPARLHHIPNTDKDTVGYISESGTYCVWLRSLDILRIYQQTSHEPVASFENVRTVKIGSKVAFRTGDVIHTYDLVGLKDTAAPVPPLQSPSAIYFFHNGVAVYQSRSYREGYSKLMVGDDVVDSDFGGGVVYSTSFQQTVGLCFGSLDVRGRRVARCVVDVGRRTCVDIGGIGTIISIKNNIVTGIKALSSGRPGLTVHHRSLLPWNDRHNRYYPARVRRAVFLLMCCRHRVERMAAASESCLPTLPLEVWIHIASFVVSGLM